jgi:hypothetical protein
MFKHLALAAAAAGLIACGGKEQAPEAQPEQPASNGAISIAHRQVVSVSEMLASSPDGRITVDMRNTDVGFRIEPTLDYSAVTVICPSSRVMNLESWLPELAGSTRKSISDLRQGFTFYPFMAPPEGSVSQQYIPRCEDADGNICEAEKEADGSWACVC